MRTRRRRRPSGFYAPPVDADSLRRSVDRQQGTVGALVGSGSLTTKAWREAFGWLARIEKLPVDGSLGACHIDAVPLTSTRRSRQDVGACLPVVKAAIDGLVDAGAWPDDTPDWVLSVTFWPQQLAADSGLRLVVTETA